MKEEGLKLQKLCRYGTGLKKSNSIFKILCDRLLELRRNLLSDEEEELPYLTC